jgi:hypothetical protein
MIGPGLFIHGGIGLTKTSLEPTVLTDWAMFDVGLFCWLPLNVRNEDGSANNSLARKMHSMSPSTVEIGCDFDYKQNILQSRQMWGNTF